MVPSPNGRKHSGRSKQGALRLEVSALIPKADKGGRGSPKSQGHVIDAGEPERVRSGGGAKDVLPSVVEERLRPSSLANIQLCQVLFQ